MKHIFSLKKSISLLSVAFACLPFTSGVAQQMTAFERVGTDDESVQEFFPVSTGRARYWAHIPIADIWDCSVAARI